MLKIKGQSIGIPVIRELEDWNKILLSCFHLDLTYKMKPINRIKPSFKVYNSHIY